MTPNPSIAPVLDPAAILDSPSREEAASRALTNETARVSPDEAFEVPQRCVRVLRHNDLLFRTSDFLSSSERNIEDPVAAMRSAGFRQQLLFEAVRDISQEFNNAFMDGEAPDAKYRLAEVFSDEGPKRADLLRVAKRIYGDVVQRSLESLLDATATQRMLHDLRLVGVYGTARDSVLAADPTGEKWQEPLQRFTEALVASGVERGIGFKTGGGPAAMQRIYDQVAAMTPEQKARYEEKSGSPIALAEIPLHVNGEAVDRNVPEHIVRTLTHLSLLTRSEELLYAGNGGIQSALPYLMSEPTNRHVSIMMPGGFGTLEEQYRLTSQHEISGSNQFQIGVGMNGFWKGNEQFMDNMRRLGLGRKETFDTIRFKDLTSSEDAEQCAREVIGEVPHRVDVQPAEARWKPGTEEVREAVQKFHDELDERVEFRGSKLLKTALAEKNKQLDLPIVDAMYGAQLRIIGARRLASRALRPDFDGDMEKLVKEEVAHAVGQRDAFCKFVDEVRGADNLTIVGHSGKNSLVVGRDPKLAETLGRIIDEAVRKDVNVIVPAKGANGIAKTVREAFLKSAFAVRRETGKRISSRLFIVGARDQDHREWRDGVLAEASGSNAAGLIRTMPDAFLALAASTPACMAFSNTVVVAPPSLDQLGHIGGLAAANQLREHIPNFMSGKSEPTEVYYLNATYPGLIEGGFFDGLSRQFDTMHEAGTISKRDEHGNVTRDDRQHHHFEDLSDPTALAAKIGARLDSTRSRY